MKFIENKYTHWYLAIIEKAKMRVLDCYYEKHHICPRSLGGTDDVSNIIKLTAREHFIVHLLLPKMLEGKEKQKMYRASIALAYYRSKNRTLDFRISSRVYQKLKEQYSELMKGPRLEATKKKMSESAKLRIRKPLSEAHKQSIAKGRTGKLHTEETKSKISKNTVGRIISEEQKEKQSQSTKGKKLSGDRLISHIARTIQLNKSRIGSKHSEETKTKMSLAHKGKKKI